MGSPIKQYFEYLSKIAELSNKTGCALQNYIAGRTSIRDYVISADDKHYAEVEERIKLTIDSLLEAEPLVEHETLDQILEFLASVRQWGVIAEQVHDGFASYRNIVQHKVLINFATITKTSNVLLQTAASLTTDMVNDVQTANVAIMNYLFSGELNQAENAQHAFDAAKAKIASVGKNNEQIDSALEAFSTSLNQYAVGFRAAVESRENAYTVFNDTLAPLGTQIQEDLEDFYDWLAETEKGINDLKVLAEHGKKGFPSVH
ncbi:MAG: hypothetical protein V4568_15895 [Pseudomonadota bacterium]